MRILLAEDDVSLSEALATFLRTGGFAVDICGRGVDILHLALTEPYAAVVLDLGLPELDGMAVLTALRAAKREMPVLVLTARGRLADKVQAFKAGADDYMTKPFAPEELVLRLQALIRRAAGRAQVQVVAGDLTLDEATNAILHNGRLLDLTHMEMRILAHLVRRGGIVVSRTELSEAVYELDSDAGFNTIEVVVSRLRKKIGRAAIETIRGSGYRLTTHATGHAIS